MTRDALLELVTSAFRHRVRGAIRPSEAWYDLDPTDRVAAHDATASARALEAALDSEGLSSTARAVLSRIPVR